MNDQNFLDALEIYYKLKSNYEAKLHKSKNKIIKNTNLSTKEKQEYIKKIIPKCINCKRPVGSIFTNENRTLRAICGDTVNPCNLHIELYKSEIIQITDMTTVLKETLEEFKENIIRTKLDLIFSYEDESTAIPNFEENKTEYIGDKQLYDSYRTEYLNIIENAKKKALIKAKEAEINKTIQDIKSIIKNASPSSSITKRPIDIDVSNYDQDQDQETDLDETPPFIFRSGIANRENLIRDAVELYVSSLVPTLESLQADKYVYMNVEDDIYADDIKRLIQKIYTNAEVEVTLGAEKPQVIALKYNG